MSDYLEQQVKNAAKWLDTVQPNWAYTINFDNLNMYHPCILDMAFGAFTHVLKKDDRTSDRTGYDYAVDRWYGTIVHTFGYAFSVRDAVPFWRIEVWVRTGK